MINASRDSRTVFTIGHGALDLGDYIDLIKTFGIDLIVDVRSSPYSRYVPHFNRELLEDALRIQGVEYRFAGEYLGGRPTAAEFFKSGEVPTGPKPNYLQLVDYSAMQETDWFQTGVDRLADLTMESTTAIQCSEENPLKCHRHFLIADWLVRHGWDVTHIRHDRSTENAAALFDDTRREAEVATHSSQLSLL